uniref:F-box domain-containing protein n=2 Tax=Anopheles triannulatus TaxID=58253 RepID=A0A2M4AIN6_9DIPT
MVSTRQMTGATSDESSLQLLRVGSSSGSSNIVVPSNNTISRAGAPQNTNQSMSNQCSVTISTVGAVNSGANLSCVNQQPYDVSSTVMGTNASSSQQQQQQQQQHQVIQPDFNLMNLPTELLEHIFSYVGYKKIGHMRVISRQMNQVCSSILNSTFQKLQNHMQTRFQTVKAKMPRRESARRNHPLAFESDILETCYMRLSLLQMTFGKHIERKHCCFFPGAILDEVYSVIRYIRTTPSLDRPFKVTDELFDLSTMAMEYFKEHIEPNLPDIAYFTTSTKSFAALETSSSLMSRDTSHSNSSSPPQSNMVLRKGIRKIKQGMKRYNNQLTVLRSELRTCKRKATEQAKTITEQQKLLAEQQKQTLEFANRLDETDKKNEELSRKFSTVLQELNKCKTELQYWRSNSPAVTNCTLYDQTVATDELEELAGNKNELTNTTGQAASLCAPSLSENDSALAILPVDDIQEENKSNCGDNHALPSVASALLAPIEVCQPTSPKQGQKRKYEYLAAEDIVGESNEPTTVNPPFASAPLASLVASYSSSTVQVASTSYNGSVVPPRVSSAESVDGEHDANEISFTCIQESPSVAVEPNASAPLPSSVSLPVTPASDSVDAPIYQPHTNQCLNSFSEVAVADNSSSSVSNNVNSKQNSIASSENTNHNKKLRKVQNKARSQINITHNAIGSAINANTKTTRSKQSDK